MSKIRTYLLLITAAILVSCSSTKHVPEGQHLVDHVNIKVDGDAPFTNDELLNYLRQLPNHKILWSIKLQLATYNLSGKDTSKWFNRWVRRIGQPPVIYDQTLTDASVKQLHQLFINKGFLHNEVTVDTVRHDAKKKIDVNYTVVTGEPHRISSVELIVSDPEVRRLLEGEGTALSVKEGDFFDRDRLDAQRNAITIHLRENGYYAFNKEYISFTADTIAGSTDVGLTINVKMPYKALGTTETLDSHPVYYVRDVYYVLDYDPAKDVGDKYANRDTVEYRGMKILCGPDRYLNGKILDHCCFISPGELYNISDVARTREALGRLPILKYVNVTIREVGDFADAKAVDAYILLTPAKKQGITVEIEGTNSEGDLGFGAGVTWRHRNIGHGGEVLTIKGRASYESISGDVSGLINNRYTEYAGEVGLSFPKFKAPFLSREFKRHMKATTVFDMSFNYQERPEYTRIIAGTAWKYKLSNHNATRRHTFDLIDINYVYLPKSSLDFIESIAPDNPLLRYSYEDHFIMKLGYSFHKSNKRLPSASSRYNRQPSVYSFRTSCEMAGNLLYAISSLTGQERVDGAYEIFRNRYSQYFKAEADYAIAYNFDQRNTLAFHVGAGIGVPYGNSTIMPFEKRFYAGGANGVRGWGVRTLGPGSYDSHNSVSDFINQCGDIRLDLNVEYRAKLFWLIEGGLFIDAGNIWTIHNYENQPGGMFHFNKFYKEIAASYGAGIRLDFTYFLLRLDLGMKAYNPAQNQEPWPLIHPKWSRDATFHFSVGYPF